MVHFPLSVVVSRVFCFVECFLKMNVEEKKLTEEFLGR